MTLKIAAFMDHPRELKPYSSLPIWLAKEAQKRGHEVYYLDGKSLTWKEGSVWGKLRRLFVNQKNRHYYQMARAKFVNLRTMDMVLMVAEPEFDMSYITHCQMLEQLMPDVPVFNDPKALHDHANKLFMNKLPHLMPPTLISSDIDEIRAFREEHGNIILKPLFETHGHGVFNVWEESQNFDTIIELMQKEYPTQWSAQKYIEEIKTEGEKRIFLLNGKYIASYQRYLNAQESRTSIFLGSQVKPCELTDNDRRIISEIGPVVNDHNFIFTGLDIIGPYVTEVNVKSPGGICYANEYAGIEVEALIMDELEKRLKQSKNSQKQGEAA